MYFEKCNDLNELKAVYKKLALDNHPDMGGDVRVMQEINAEYDRMFLLLKAKQNTIANDDTTGKTRRTTEAPEEFRSVVSALLKIEVRVSKSSSAAHGSGSVVTLTPIARR